MLDTGTVYSHSGRWGTSLILLPLIGLPAAIIIGIVYAYVDVYCPIAGYVSILFTGGCGFGIGWILSRTAVWSRCRSVGIVAILSLLIGVVTLYASWAGFVHAMVEHGEDGVDVSLLQVFLHPQAVWHIATLINEDGWYTIHGGSPHGTVLWVIWSIEAILIVGLATIIPVAKLRDMVFCELCDRWCTLTKGRVRLAIPQDGAELDHVAEGEVAALEALPPARDDAAAYLTVDTHHCENDPDMVTFQVTLVTSHVNKKGQTETKTHDLTRHVLANRSTLERLDALANREPPEDETTEEEPSE